MVSAACELTMEETELLDSFLRTRTDCSGALAHAQSQHMTFELIGQTRRLTMIIIIIIIIHNGLAKHRAASLHS